LVTYSNGTIIIERADFESAAKGFSPGWHRPNKSPTQCLGKVSTTPSAQAAGSLR
jgi:hypothetical protein